MKVLQAFRCVKEYLLFIRSSKPDALGSWLLGIFHGETFPHKTTLLLVTRHKEPLQGAVVAQLPWHHSPGPTVLAPQQSPGGKWPQS